VPKGEKMSKNHNNDIDENGAQAVESEMVMFYKAGNITAESNL
jgi:hypothetical protein